MFQKSEYLTPKCGTSSPPKFKNLQKIEIKIKKFLSDYIRIKIRIEK